MARKLQNNYTEESKPWNLIITQSPHSVQISLFFTPCPFALPGPHAAFRVTVRHCALCAPTGCDSSQVSLVFEDVDGFEEYWSGVLLTVPQFGFV